jgi:hypothetical protein
LGHDGSAVTANRSTPVDARPTDPTLTDPSWVRPYWVERQADPRSVDFVPGTVGRDPRNVTHRNWTTLGTLAAPERATIDPRGLLAPSVDRWSIDWWIGAEDDWHVPSRDEVVRQRLIGEAPVVETAMRVPGGDALHRAYGYNSTDLGPCVVLEMENRTAVPFAVVFAIRPYDVLGRGQVRSIDLLDTTVVVNGHPALVLPKAPAHTVGSSSTRGDCAAVLFANGATAGWAGPVEDPTGRATAAFVYPLAHTALLRVLVPLADTSGSGSGSRLAPRRRTRTAVPAALPFPDGVPSAEQVAKGWEAQTRRGLLVLLPDDRLQRAVEVARAQLLLNHGGSELVAPGTELDFMTAAQLVTALDDWGFAAEARDVLSRWNEMQALDGTFVPDDAPADHRDANGAALAALGHHWALTRDDGLIESLIGPIAKAVHRIDKLRTARRAERDPHADGLLPVGRGALVAGEGEELGAYLRDDAVAVAGLRSIALAADGIAQPGVAEDARRFATSLADALDSLVSHLAGREGGALPATPARRLDAGVVANLDLVTPVGCYGADHPAVAATVELVRQRWCVEDAVFLGTGPDGLDPALTMGLARAELRVSDRRAWDRISWMLDRMTPTGGWPSTIHPRTRGGSTRSPQDAAANAGFLAAVRDQLVHEVIDPATGRATGLALLGVMPVTWLGMPIDVRDAPTAFGPLSYSLRWHGERPALLWEVVVHDAAEPCTITAPGLDPAWSTTDASGEALLAAVPVPAAIRAERGEPVDPSELVTPPHDHGHGHGHDQGQRRGHESPVSIDLRRKPGLTAGWSREEPPAPGAAPTPDTPTEADGPGTSFQ